MKIAPFVLLGAPTQCDGRPGGVERAPNVLRDLGVAGAIGASVDLGDLPVRIDGPDRDPASGVIGAASAARSVAPVTRWTLFLAMAIGRSCSAGAAPMR